MGTSIVWSGTSGASKMSDAVMGPAAAQLDGITSIAVIDDALESLVSIKLPAQEEDAVEAFFGDLKDQAVIEEFAECGFDEETLKDRPLVAIEALTAPNRILGAAYAELSSVSETLEKVIRERHAMRCVVRDMREASGCEVMELTPSDELNVRDKQLVFIDYYLEKNKADGDLAVAIAKKIEDDRDPDLVQQIVLMSSLDSVRSFRRNFRRTVGIRGSAFAFVAKDDLDEPWKVRAHLKMFAGALPHSGTIGEYIRAAKESLSNARDRLIGVLDDLDLGDYAYIQKLSLQADGHPLGNYLSWLFSSHLAALAFEDDLRTQQSEVDKIEFEEMLISPVEPSTIVATLYHDALFERNVGPLGPHPREAEGSDYRDVPLVGLGDVFVDAGRTKAVVILSADCDLAFAPNSERKPDREMPVLVVEGVPRKIDDVRANSAAPATEGVRHGSEVYRIDWEFKTYRTVPLGELEDYLSKKKVDLSERDRLRPLYALKLQNDFGRQLLRPGHPVMPPFRKGVRGVIVGAGDPPETVNDLGDLFLSSALEGGKRTIRVTPAIAGRLKQALEVLHSELLGRLPNGEDADQEDADPSARFLKEKVKAIGKVLDSEENWVGLLGEVELPGVNVVKKLMNGVYIAQGKEWQAPKDPAVVFQVIDMESG